MLPSLHLPKETTTVRVFCMKKSHTYKIYSIYVLGESQNEAQILECEHSITFDAVTVTLISKLYQGLIEN